MQVSCVKGRNADQLHLHWMLLKDVSLFEVIKNNYIEEFKFHCKNILITLTIQTK